MRTDRLLLSVRSERSTPGFPLVCDLYDYRGIGGKDESDARASQSFSIEVHEHVARAQAAPTALGQGEHAEGLWHVLFGPCCKTRSGVLVLLEEALKQPFSVRLARDIEDRAERASGQLSADDARGVMDGATPEVELAALSSCAREVGAHCLLQPGVVVADDYRHAVQTSLAKTVEELAPTHLGFGSGNNHC